MKQFLSFLFLMSLLVFVSGAKAQTEMLTGGNMEDAALWQTSILNSPAEALPTATWGSTNNTLAAGSGGNLHVTGTSNNTTVQYCIYQAVTLSSDKIYAFDGAFKLLQTNNSWCEVFIGTSAPADGADYGGDQTKLVAVGAWATPDTDDGTFAANGIDYKTFSPAESGDFFFVIKMGSTSWDGSNQTIEMAIDEISLMEEEKTEAPTVTAGGLIVGGEMEDVSNWSTSLLNTNTGKEPTATWNSDKPIASGKGGSLHVTGTTNDGNSQYCIYQKVTLSNDKLYAFDGAFKAIQINNSWCEVFIGTEPVSGADYGTDQFRLAAFGTWANYSKEDGIFSKDLENYAKFAPETSGDYYFVLKMGSTSWDGSDQTFEIIVDELSLVAEEVAPIVDFSANVVTGLVPLEVTFTDNSKFAESWEWNFGDGSTSTDQNPTHTYTSDGLYTVTLKASNGVGSNELTCSHHW